MILLDLNQIILASLHVSLGKHAAGEIDLHGFRQMVANAIWRVNGRFRREYGELILCADGRQYWRKEIFPFYKFSRGENRAKSNLNWEGIYECLDATRADLQAFFPYKYICIPRAEADDIISVLCRKAWGKKLIVSADRDFVQLHNENVKQFDSVQNKFVTPETTPEDYLFEHIIRGDRGDGIPNIFSEDNALAVKIRQKPITQKVLAEIRATGISEDHPAYQGFLRNTKLIDLSQIPADIESEILNEFAKPVTNTRRDLMKYFMTHRMRGQLEHLNDF